MTRPWNYRDLTGRRFGRLRVIEDAGRSPKKRTMWRCKCDCGKEVVVMSHNLTTGRTKSCGCLQKEALENARCARWESKLYIAYGSNLDTAQMKYRCPGAKVVSRSWLPGYKLVFQGRLYCAHANVIPDKKSRVPVVIWKITRDDEKNLDRYEGVRGGYYTREFMDVDVNGKKKKALIYIMTPNAYGNPTSDYYTTLMNGYREFDFPIDILVHAVAESRLKAQFGREV